MKVKVTIKDELKKIEKAARSTGPFQSLGHAGGTIRKSALLSIRKNKKSSKPGQPPHTREGQLRKAIFYAVDKAAQTVVIGPTKSKIGEIGGVMEHGGTYKGGQYAPRPFMGPALEESLPRIPAHFTGSIGE